jgi:hypothetical protein
MIEKCNKCNMKFNPIWYLEGHKCQQITEEK